MPIIYSLTSEARLLRSWYFLIYGVLMSHFLCGLPPDHDGFHRHPVRPEADQRPFLHNNWTSEMFILGPLSSSSSCRSQAHSGEETVGLYNQPWWSAWFSCARPRWQHFQLTKDEIGDVFPLYDQAKQRSLFPTVLTGPLPPLTGRGLSDAPQVPATWPSFT